MRWPRLLLTTAASLMALSCDDEGITDATARTPSLVIFPGGGEGQTAPVGTTLPLPLLVQVTEVAGPANGQVVNFVVTSGGGRVFAAVVLTGTPTTGPAAKQSGIAQNTWTLGPEAGSQTLEARLVDSRTGALLTVATFHATGVAGNANVIRVSAGDRQTAVAGTALGIAPAVIVADQAGNPIPNVEVTFLVGTGGGSITGPTQVTTSSSGIAVVGGWRVGTSTGPNTLLASSAGLVGSPVTFTAAATVGAASQLLHISGNGQDAALNGELADPMIVQVQDQHANGVPGVAVTFTVTTGGGNMSGITSVTTLTDQAGKASVGWTMGGSVGPNTLRATALGLSGSPVLFDATAFVPLYVANLDANSITVYRSDAAGNAAAIRTISGPSTGLNGPSGLVSDAAGRLYVSNINGHTITVYAANAAGNAAPIRTITGPATGIIRPYALLRDAAGQLYVGNFGTQSITVYAADAVGNATPVRSISGPATGLEGPVGFALGSGGRLHVTSFDHGSVRIFAETASGNASPIRVITGPNSGLNGPTGIALDASGQIYVANFTAQTITVHAADAEGDMAPLRTISGGSTLLSRPVGLARDAFGQIYVANYVGQSITVYQAGAFGNSSPIRVLSGGATGLTGPNWVTF